MLRVLEEQYLFQDRYVNLSALSCSLCGMLQLQHLVGLISLRQIAEFDMHLQNGRKWQSPKKYVSRMMCLNITSQSFSVSRSLLLSFFAVCWSLSTVNLSFQGEIYSACLHPHIYSKATSKQTNVVVLDVTMCRRACVEEPECVMVLEHCRIVINKMWSPFPAWTSPPIKACPRQHDTLAERRFGEGPYHGSCGVHLGLYQWKISYDRTLWWSERERDGTRCYG